MASTNSSSTPTEPTRPDLEADNLERRLQAFADGYANARLSDAPSVNIGIELGTMVRYIQLLIATKVAEARKDELNLMVKAEEHLDDFSTPEYPYSFNAYAYREQRIAELNQRQSGKEKV